MRKVHITFYTLKYQNIMYLMKERRSGYQDRGGERIISRMYSISPSDPERFYLRLLLLHVPGAKSLDELKMIGGRIAVSFRETCIRKHLLTDDSEHGISNA